MIAQVHILYTTKSPDSVLQSAWHSGNYCLLADKTYFHASMPLRKNEPCKPRQIVRVCDYFQTYKVIHFVSPSTLHQKKLQPRLLRHQRQREVCILGWAQSMVCSGELCTQLLEFYINFSMPM